MNRRDSDRDALTRRDQEMTPWQSGFGFPASWDPWREMQSMRQRMDDMFSRFFGSSPMAMQDEQEPDVDMFENENEFVVKAALPGVDPKDIHLEATENGIRLTAECRYGEEPKAQETGQKATQHMQSRFSRTNRFQFAYTLPEEIRPDEVKANLRNGVLELHMPKARPQSRQSVHIPIDAGTGPVIEASPEGASAQGQGRPKAMDRAASQAKQPPEGAQASEPNAGSQRKARKS